MGWHSGQSTNSWSGHITPGHRSCPKILSPPFKIQTSLGIQEKKHQCLRHQPGKYPKFIIQRCCFGALGTEPCPSTSEQPALMGALHNYDSILEVFSNLKDSLINQKTQCRRDSPPWGNSEPSWPSPSHQHLPAQPPERCYFQSSPQQNTLWDHIRAPGPHKVCSGTHKTVQPSYSFTFSHPSILQLQKQIPRPLQFKIQVDTSYILPSPAPLRLQSAPREGFQLAEKHKCLLKRGAPITLLIFRASSTTNGAAASLGTLPI